jgi:2-phosphoglycolate phosphatase
MNSKAPPPLAERCGQPPSYLADGDQGLAGDGHRAQLRLVIFDFDGVLADTAEDHVQAANAVLTHCGMLPVSPLEVRGLIGGTAEALMQRLMVDANPGQVREAASLFKEIYATCYDRSTRLYSGVLGALDALRTEGALLAVATNKAEAITRDLAQKLGILSYFREVVGPESVTNRKPDPEPIQLILSRLQLPAGSALMVGDAATDIIAGKRAGTLTCAAYYGFGAASELEAAEPDFGVSCIQEIPGLLSSTSLDLSPR